MSDAVATLDNPIINSPYEPPGAHFELGPSGPTGKVEQGRRPSESFVAIPTGPRSKASASDGSQHVPPPPTSAELRRATPPRGRRGDLMVGEGQHDLRVGVSAADGDQHQGILSHLLQLRTLHPSLVSERLDIDAGTAGQSDL